jgi:hypothetical protein
MSVDETSARTRAPHTVDIVVGNTATPLPKASDGGENTAWFEWTCFVRPTRPVDADLITSVEFALHPSFHPSRVLVTTAAVARAGATFAVTRKGWGTFVVGVKVTARDGHVHEFSHELIFTEGGESTTSRRFDVEPWFSPDGRSAGAATPSPPAHRSDQPRALDARASARSQPRMSDVSEELMHGHDGVGQGWAAPLLTMQCDEEARPGYQTEKAHEYHDDDTTLHAKVSLATIVNHCECTVAGVGVRARLPA